MASCAKPVGKKATPILKSNFISTLQKKYPGLDKEPLDSLISELLLSSFTLELPRSVLTQAEKAIDEIFSFQKKNYSPSFHPGNHAIAMSYDFHLNEKNELKLIEINTNASFLLMSLSLYDTQKVPKPTAFSEADLQKDVLDEMELCFGKRSPPKAIAIIDDTPPSQKLYVEFLLYQSLFKSFGWDCEICDFRELQFDEKQNVLTAKGKKFDFIYNRYTDFLLENPESQTLKKAFLGKAACFSPNPTEYETYADKERLIELGTTGSFSFILQSEELTSENRDRIWDKRKSLFFKPLRSFGSKQSYRGASISRKAFDELGEGTLAQEFCPAGERSFSTPNGDQNFKFDLRFYAYQNRLETVIARLYQGQVTNTRTPYGGFAPIRFV